MSKELYNNLWDKDWGDMQEYGPLHIHIRKAIIRHLSPLNIGSALDVGCGAGHNLREIRNLLKVTDLTGIDLSEQALYGAHAKVQDAKLICADINDWGSDRKFDLVMSIHSIEHILDDIKALQMMRKFAGKYLYVSTIGGTMRKSEPGIGHVRNYSQVELTEKIELAGFKVIRFEKWGFPFYSPIYRSLVEMIPGGPPTGRVTISRQVMAKIIDKLYSLNSNERGDIYNVLAEIK